MGIKERAFGPLPPLTLEDLVPPGHFYRHLERALDLSFVRDLVRTAYAGIGRPSVDPVVFFKLQLVLFFAGLRSERQLMRVVADRLSLRWYLGYDLTEPLPDHSSLTRIRERYGLDVFRRFFEHVGEQCVAAGLVWGQELYVDATKVEGDAALESLRPRFAVEAHLAALFAGAQAESAGENGGASDDAGHDGEATATTGSAPVALPVALSDAARADLAAAAAARHDWIGEAGRPDRSVVRAGYRRQADFWASTTDPDATPLRPPNTRPHLGYHDHYLVDGGKARIVLAALVTPAEVTENLPRQDLLWRVRFRWKLRPRPVTGDATYGTIDNIVALEDQRVRAYLPLGDFDHRTPFFGRAAFACDADADVYRCPGDETLRLRALDTVTRVQIDKAPTGACTACALKPQCTGAAGGRRVHRSFDEAYLERVRGYQATEPYQEAIRKRRVWVEPLFAEAKDWHGRRRFRLRGLPKVNGEALLIAAGQNLKRLLSRWGWGRRPWPNGAAGLVLPTPATAPPAHR